MPSFSSKINRHPYILFFLFSILLCLSRSWEGVLDGDSMWYTILAQGVAENGFWDILYYRGKPFFDHPPLGIWLIALLFKVFGVSVYVAKFMNALALFGTTALIYKIGKYLKDENCGVIAGIIFLLTPQVIQLTGKIKLDMPLVFFSTLAMYGVILGSIISRRYYWLFGLGTALALLTKGVVGLAPVPVAFLSLILLKKWRDLFSLHFIIGLSLIVLIPLPWVLLVLSRLGTAPFIIYWHDHVQYAALLGRGEDRLPGFWYFAGVILTRGAPWSWVGIVTIFLLAKRWFKNGLDNSVFLVSWVVMIYLGYSIPKFKYSYYIFPIYPPLSVLAAFLLSKFASKEVVIKYSYVACAAVAFIISVFPVPLRLERSQGIVSILPAIIKAYEEKGLLKIGMIDVHPTDENNTYQLVAMNINPGIVVRSLTKSAWKSRLKLENDDNFDLVIINKRSMTGFRRELRRLRPIAFSNEYELFERLGERE